jgi:PTS system nitrogen regulatory IIA component
MKVVDFLAPDAVIPALVGTSKAEVLAEMASFLAARPATAGAIDAQTLCRLVAERERVASTAIGEGIAIPHAKLDGLERMVGALGRSPGGLAFDSFDGKPTYLVFMLAVPASSETDHLKALARLVRLFREAAVRERLLAAPDGDSMYRTIAEEDAKS